MCLVQAWEAEDQLTKDMRAAADAELAARAEAQAHVDAIKAKLAEKGVHPWTVIRQDDPPDVISLKTELKKWRARLREEIHPAHATSRR